ncbi:hypothetical protein [uncultured Fibrobacter sp.]|uniref:hypothetical protein n=1 Tax=uncultured Fibrobacter sp. TaxID=261512 RepID=UPI0026392841|nr:hypothetical protein [uncultured Fibrobacter sp.]
MLDRSVNAARIAKTLSGVSLALAFGLGFSACSDSENKTAGGGPSGTEAGNAITAQILTADKTPAALAKVRLMDSESLNGTDAYETDANDDGMVNIEGVADGDYILEARLNGEALQQHVKVSSEGVDLGKTTLKSTATVKGSVGDTSANGTIKVRGMEHSTKVKKGDFTLDSLPEGPLSLVYIPEGNGDTTSSYVAVSAGEKSIASTFAEESRSLLLDDFQDSNYQNRFMPAHVYDGGWWYFDYSAENVTPEFVVGKEHRFSLANLDGNIVAHIAAEFGEVVEDSSGNAIWPWATIGIELGKSDKSLCNDISSVDSVAFLVKGKGAIVFSVINENLEQDHQKIIQHEHGLADKWERVSIPLQDAKEALKCANQLSWDFKTTNEDSSFELWLDDIELIGGDRLSIWEK